MLDHCAVSRIVHDGNLILYVRMFRDGAEIRLGLRVPRMGVVTFRFDLRGHDLVVRIDDGIGYETLLPGFCDRSISAARISAVCRHCFR